MLLISGLIAGNWKNHKTNSACKYLIFHRHSPNHVISWIQIFSPFPSSFFRNDCLFYKSVSAHVNTIFINVHHSSIYYSLLSFMILIHLKNLGILFLESGQHFVIWKPRRHHREQKYIANTFRRPCTDYLVVLMNVEYILYNSNHYSFSDNVLTVKNSANFS